MKLKKINVYTGSLFVLIISLSLTVSTLHSHNHIEWHHPQNHVDTGTCLIVDSAQCPICGYLLNAEVTRPAAVKVPFTGTDVISEPALPSISKPDLFYTTGRSPPVLV